MSSDNEIIAQLHAENEQLRQRIAYLEAHRTPYVQEASSTNTIFPHLFDDIPVPMTVYNLNGLVITINRAAEQLWHLQRQHVAGLVNVYTDEQSLAQDFPSFFRRALQGEICTTPPIHYDIAETGLKRSADIRLWIEMTFFPLYDDQGCIVYVAQSQRDITNERQQIDTMSSQQQVSATQLYQSQTLLQGVLENAPMLIVARDIEGRYLMISHETARLMRRDVADIVGKTDAELFDPDVAARLKALDDQVLQTGKLSAIEQNLVYEDNLFTYKSTRFALRNEQNEIYAVCSISNDITEQVQRERDLALFKLLVENSPDGIGIANTEGVFAYANPAYAQMTGYDDLVGMHVQDLIITDTISTDEILAYMLTGTGTWSGEMMYQRRDGTTFPVHVSIFVTRDAQGNISGFPAIVRDITDQRAHQKERDAIQQQIIDAQKAVLSELSSPLIPISDHVVIMPLIGSIDSHRAQQVMEVLLEGIARYQADTAILDITGVRVVDTQVADALIRAARAVQLLGARVLLTGIQPQIAQTLVHLGVDLREIDTRGTLQAGIAAVLGLA
ncbi:MAG: PAS domain S-box protein [Chloroflexaceae bacterium]|nr:PAS domain S-box protein [Chloroflexaceae bacterium]